MTLAKPARTYNIELPAFTGPLDLLLYLIDREELDITAISLAQVTEQYMAQIEAMKKDRIEQLIDFLVIGARLVLIKSRALLPQESMGTMDGEDEEDPAEALIRQLRAYRKFKKGAAWLKDREEQGLRSYLRVAPPPKMQGKLDLSGVTIDTLIAAMNSALSRVENLEDSVALVAPRKISIRDQMQQLRHKTRNQGRVAFEALLTSSSTRVEVAITLLAVLELIKRREIMAIQETMFGPITIVGTDGEQGAEQDAGDEEDFDEFVD